MGNWTIAVAQLPIKLGSFDTGQNHNIILIRDDTGKIYREIDGGPVDAQGKLIAFGSNSAAQALTAYTSGPYQVGAAISLGSAPTLYQPGLPESQPLFSGTQSEVLSRLKAAQTAIDSFDPSGRYTLTGGSVTDSQTGGTTPGYNSNSVASTLLSVMGIDPNSPLIPSQATPGSDLQLLSPSQIQDIIQQQNANAPGGNIPYPPPRSNKRTDNPDEWYSLGDAKLASEKAPLTIAARWIRHSQR